LPQTVYFSLKGLSRCLEGRPNTAGWRAERAARARVSQEAGYSQNVTLSLAA